MLHAGIVSNDPVHLLAEGIVFDYEPESPEEILAAQAANKHEVLDLPLDLGQVRQRARDDINFFSGLCLPETMRYLFPSYYIALWLSLINAIEENNKTNIQKVMRYVIGLPRGFCKTTFLKCLTAWLICHGYVHFVLIICATDPLADSFLSDLHNILQSPNLEKLYGRWDPAKDRVDTKVGIYQGRVLLIKARGAGTAVRGINEDNKRPDFILCDDMQTKENDASDTDSVALFNWFVGTLLKTVTQQRSIIMYVGNMYSDHCILYQLKINRFWISLITGCILADGESLWPELFSLEDLYDSFLHDESLGKADIWFAEMMNDPIESLDSLLKGPFPELLIQDFPNPDAAFITIDPAGFRTNSDDNVITGHSLIDGKGYVEEMDGGIWTPKETVSRGISMALRLNASLIGVEGVAYQKSLSFWFQYFLLEAKITGIEVVSIKRSTNKTKAQVIRNFIQEIYSKNYYFKRPEDRAKFTWQAAAYRIHKTKNKDDWLDSPSMGLDVRNEYGHLLTVRKASNRPKRSVVGGNTPF